MFLRRQINHPAASGGVLRLQCRIATRSKLRVIQPIVVKPKQHYLAVKTHELSDHGIQSDLSRWNLPALIEV